MSCGDGFDTDELKASEEVGRTSSSSSSSTGRQRGSGLSAFLFLQLDQLAAAGRLSEAGSLFLEPLRVEIKQLNYTGIQRQGKFSNFD